MTLTYQGKKVEIKGEGRLRATYIEGRFYGESQSSIETLVQRAKDIIEGKDGRIFATEEGPMEAGQDT